jgi:formyltetrahydrofolate-dependent phosphoribosylglycinamide formyltransferase
MDGLKKLAILVGPSGRGSNMAAIIRACRNGLISAEVGVVISPSEAALALQVAHDLATPTRVVPYGDAYAERLRDALLGIDLVCLAGYLRLLPSAILDQFPNAVLNIHPALLPKFGGKGMYGIHVHTAVLAAGETESGCTVHYVTDHYDEGQVIHQKTCPVYANDTPEDLAARVLQLEHVAYPQAIQHVLNSSPL